MANEPTAWDDINPPMVSAPRQERRSPCLVPLMPASSDDFRNELTACLTLVAPVGMNEEAKRDWLLVAWGTLKHLPSDLLSHGCTKARETCDHPSKIVPTILEATKQGMKWRTARHDVPDRPRLTKQYVKPEEAASILREFGLRR